MQEVTYVHSRSSSPTMRMVSPTATITANEAGPASSSGTRRPRRVPAGFDDLPRVKQHANGVTETRYPGQSYKTLARPVHPDELPLEHPHTILDCGYLSSMSLPTRLMERLKESFGGAPIMHLAETTSVELARGVAGKETLEAAIQKVDNVKKQCEQLRKDYQIFAEHACELLAMHAAASSTGKTTDAAAMSVPLLRIIKQVWPTLRFATHEEKDTWLDRALQDPKPFIAQSYDALDLALGQIAIDFPLAKQAIWESWGHQSDAEKDAVFRGMQEAGAAFISVREAFTEGKIPVDELIMKGHSLATRLKNPLPISEIVEEVHGAMYLEEVYSESAEKPACRCAIS